MREEFDFIGKSVEYCTQILELKNIAAEYISYISPREDNISAEKIIVRQRYKEDGTLELVYCLFS